MNSFKRNLLSGGKTQRGVSMGDAVEVAANVGTGKGAAWKNAALVSLSSVVTGVAAKGATKPPGWGNDSIDSLPHDAQVRAVYDALIECLPPQA